MGVDAESRDRAREERICRRAELDDSDGAPTIDWAEAQRRQDAIDAEAKRR